MWRGPSAALIATYSDPLTARIARKASQQSISFRIANNGRSAVVERLSGGDGHYTLTPIGEIEGADPLNCYFQIALGYLAPDSELLGLLGEIVARRADEIDDALHKVTNKIESLANTVSDSLVTLRRRYV